MGKVSDVDESNNSKDRYVIKVAFSLTVVF